MEYEMGDRTVVVHFGWPMSSWLDRMSTGVMIYNMLKLPRLYPKFKFNIEYNLPFPIQPFLDGHLKKPYTCAVEEKENPTG
jgi:hypothetical protein